MTPHDAAVAAWWSAIAHLAVVAAVVVDLAAAHGRDPAGSVRRCREAGAAAAMALGAVVIGIPYGVALRALWSLLEGLAPSTLTGTWAEHRVLAWIAAFVAWDLSGWIYHAIGHRTRVGWAAHRPHHTATGFDASVALRLSWAPFHGLLHHPLLALTGLDLGTVLVCAAASNLLQALQHLSGADRTPRWLRAVVITPEAHRHHHLTGGRANLGPVLTVWDRLAGTRRSGPVPAGASYGDDRRASTHPMRAELDGWCDLARRSAPRRGRVGNRR